MGRPRQVRALLRSRTRTGDRPLAGIDPARTPGRRGRPSRDELDADAATLQQLQERLYAEGRRSVLLILQGMDTAGKGGTISHVIGLVDPQGVRITGFKAPTPEELRHDFLWRIRKALPRAREIGIFDRSHYEDVLIVRVKRLVPRAVWSKRYAEINRFEREVARAGTTVVKIFLHLSFEEQRERLVARLEDPTKHWKFNPRDLDERDRWADYQLAYEAALRRCSTGTAPWYVVPADKKWYRNWAITRILIETLEEMDPRYPTPDLDVPALLERLRPPATRSPRSPRSPARSSRGAAAARRPRSTPA